MIRKRIKKRAQRKKKKKGKKIKRQERKRNDSDGNHFSADIASPYRFLIDGDGPADILAITGKLTDHGIAATVNDKIRIDYAENQLIITSDDIGFNVPALISFSRPEYNFTGLPLDSAVVGMKFKNMLATFESMEFISPSLQASGIGWIDFSERLMDIDVSLTTQRKDNLRKIPIAGYILHGKKGEASMIIKIKGGVDDPEVTHSLFREIISKPFKILFRTLGLPIHALQELNRESENQQQTDQTMN